MNEISQKFQSNKPYVEGSMDYNALLKTVKNTSTIKVNARKTQKEQEHFDEQMKALREEYDIEEIEQEQAQAQEAQYEEELTKTYNNKEINELDIALRSKGYIPNTSILYTLRNAMLLNKPILIEGDPGVGKTSLAEAVAAAYNMELIKVQFYSGITNSDILYEYDYPKQMLYMNAIRDNINDELKGLSANDALKKLAKNGIDFFGEDFLIKRPLLKAISGEKRSVLLLDEIDKSEEDVEFMLLEILDGFSITIPEYGTITCKEDVKPIVFLTSNRYRELSDAMKRRCLYLYIEPKSISETAEIISNKAEVSNEFALQVAKKVSEIRKLNLKQKPSISDSINWAIALINGMGINAFDDANVQETLGVLLKNRTDIEITKRAKIV